MLQRRLEEEKDVSLLGRRISELKSEDALQQHSGDAQSSQCCAAAPGAVHAELLRACRLFHQPFPWLGHTDSHSASGTGNNSGFLTSTKQWCAGTCCPPPRHASRKPSPTFHRGPASALQPTSNFVPAERFCGALERFYCALLATGVQLEGQPCFVRWLLRSPSTAAGAACRAQRWSPCRPFGSRFSAHQQLGAGTLRAVLVQLPALLCFPLTTWRSS